MEVSAGLGWSQDLGGVRSVARDEMVKSKQTNHLFDCRLEISVKIRSPVIKLAIFPCRVSLG